MISTGIPSISVRVVVGTLRYGSGRQPGNVITSISCPEAIKRRANSYERVPVADAGLAKYRWS